MKNDVGGVAISGTLPIIHLALDGTNALNRIEYEPKTIYSGSEDKAIETAEIIAAQDRYRFIGFLGAARVGPGVHERYHKTLDDLKERAEKLPAAV